MSLCPIPTRKPPIRASDYDLALSDPFLYFLKVRCGLIPALYHSEALSRGTWSHLFAERLFDTPQSRQELLGSKLDERLQEIHDKGQELSIPIQSIEDRMEKERRDALCALGWFEAWRTLPISSEYGTLLNYLAREEWQDLGPEITAIWRDPATNLNFVARFDRLLYYQPKRELWILDFKTCDVRPDIRLQICPLEAATYHYLLILKACLPQLLEEYLLLPTDVTVGGMMHVALQKPSIEFCSQDRPFKEVEHVLKSGPRKGQIEIRKEYLSEVPNHSLYIQRCERWLRGAGEYLEFQAERTAYPAVNISFTPAALVLDGDAHLLRQRNLIQYATMDLDGPLGKCYKDFPRNPSNLLDFGRLSVYAPFYLTPASMWPEIIAREKFIQHFRDPELDNITASCIIPSSVGAPS